MLDDKFIIKDPQGLHAQASAKLVQVLSAFQSKVELHANGRVVNAKSIMGVMLLAASPNTEDYCSRTYLKFLIATIDGI
jgi:phosphocarrier protein HPr